MTGPLPLLCLPHAGGSRMAFTRWSRAMRPEGFTVVPIRPDGAGSLTEAARSLLGRIPPDGPFALLGHSMGGLVAYEMARLACAWGRPPEFVVLSGCRPPHLPSGLFTARMAGLPAGELLDRLAGLGAVPAGIGRSPMAEGFAERLRRDLALVATGLPHRTRLPVDLLLWHGRTDAVAPAAAVGAWAGYTDRTTTVTPFPGGHFFLYEQPDLCGAALTERLARWRATGERTERHV